MSYVGAPYNFVPLGKKVYRKDEMTKHSEISGLSGYLEYQVTAKTPIIVDGGDKHFYKNKDGKAAIPGSTMRGLVRSNMQILNQSSIADDIANAKLMYRCVGGSSRNLNKKVYDGTLGSDTVVVGKGRFSVLKNVKGGYIGCKNGKYYIIPSSIQTLQRELGEMNYYVLSERRIIEDKFRGFEMLRKSPCVLQNSNTRPFVKEARGNRVQYKGDKNVNYKPYFKTVYYQPKGMRNISALCQTECHGNKCRKTCHHNSTEIDAFPDISLIFCSRIFTGVTDDRHIFNVPVFCKRCCECNRSGPVGCTGGSRCR